MLTKNRSVTLADVAERAGVSRSTVSLYINGKLHRMNKKTQERIGAAITAVGYTTDPIARSLSTGKTMAIGLAWDASNYDYYFEDIYFMYFAKMVAQNLKTHGYSLILIDPNDIKSKYKIMDGLIIKATASTWKYVAEAVDLAKGFPIVSLGKFFQENRTPSISVNDIEAGRNGVEYLARTCRHIHVLSFPNGRIIGFDERLSGARQAADALGVRLTVELGEMNEAFGEKALKRLAKKNALPDGLFCLNDITAVGALKACRDVAIEVPTQLSVMGVDDTPSVSYCLGLSTVRHPIGDLASAACTSVINAVRNPGLAIENVVLPTVIIPRNTTHNE